jgi:hypothetical protein
VKLSSASGLAEVAAAVSAALERHGIEVALTGGACASLWSGGRYSSLDLDFIVTAPATRQAQDDAMSSVGFVREGDRYVHPAVRFWVEFPRGPLAVGTDLSVRPVEIPLGRRRVRGLSATDSCRNRLAAFYFWSDRQSLEVAVWIAVRNRVDLARIKAWSREEGHEAGCREFLDALKRGRGRAPEGAPAATRKGRVQGALVLLAALAGASPSARSVAQTWSGYVEAKGFAYSDRASERDPWVVGWGTAQATFERRLSPSLRLSATARAEAISSGSRGLFLDLADRDVRRAPLSLREAWVSWSVAPTVDLEAGRFLLGWGKTDGYSPADAFLPRDLTDPVADEKLPLWGVRARGQKGAVRFDGVFVPVGTPWRVPVASPRFAPVAARSPLGLPIVLVDGVSDLPRTGWGALRLLATLGDWDVGAWGRTGVRPAPLLTARPDRAHLDGDAVVLPADRRFAREEAGGVELSRVTGAWVLRAEAAVLSSDDPGLGDALVWTFGTERAFGDGTLLLTLAANARGTPVDPLLLFDRAVLPAFIGVWQRTERWGSWRAVWMQGLRHGDGLAKAEVSWNATDRLGFTVGADVPYGSRSGPFGARPDLERIRTGVRWAF